MIQFQCLCGKVLQAKEEYIGLEITCPACGKTMAIPDLGKAIQPTTEPAVGRPSQTAPPGAQAERPRAQRPPQPEMSGKALAALILGGLTFLLPVVAAIPALVLGILALRDIARRSGQLTGKGLAIGGLALAVAGNITILPIVLVYQGVRESRAQGRSADNLKQLALGMHAYHDTYHRFPAAGNVLGPPNTRPHSWRVAILPYIEQEALFRQYRLEEPWDSPHNLELLSQMPEVYAPVHGKTLPAGMTYYQVFTGPNTPFRPGNSAPRMVDFTDGTSNTILIAEGEEAVPWTKPVDIEISPARPLPRLGGMWRDGFIAAMADGSVRWVDTRRIREHTLRLAIDPRDGMPLPPEWEADRIRQPAKW
jgi:hypothetical protein